MARYKGTLVQMSPSFFRELENFMEDNKLIAENVQWALDKIIMGYAYATVGFAQQRSKGPYDPGQRNKAAAWLIPVRRITGQYYAGWYAQRLAPSVWMVSNKSREAFYVEFGINHPHTGLSDSAGNRVRVRRPILKLSIMEAVAFAEGTNFDIKELAGLWKMSGVGAPPKSTGFTTTGVGVF